MSRVASTFAGAIAALWPSQGPGLPPHIQSALDQWRLLQQSTTWDVFLDEETLMGRTLFNGSTPGNPDPQDDEDWFLLARGFLQDAYGIMGIDADTLVDSRVCMIPLGIVGSTDKTTVRFAQEVSGIPVRAGFVNALFDMQGHLLSLDSDALPHLSGFDVDPSTTSTAASAVASAAFQQDTGAPPTSVGDAVLTIFQQIVSSQRSPLLVWEFAVSGGEDAYLYRVSADQATPDVVDRESLTHDAFQQGGLLNGTVKAKVTTGAPDWNSDPADGTSLELIAMPYIYVKKLNGSILTTTDASGSFSLPASLSPISIKLTFDGPYATVCALGGPGLNLPCANYQVTATVVAGSQNSIVINPTYDAANPGQGELVVARANAFLRINEMRDWIRAVNPCDDTFDLVAPYKMRPNRTNFCNAAYT